MKLIFRLISKKSILFFLIFLIIVLNTIYNKNMFNLKKRLNYSIIEYDKGANIFNDREYTDISNSNYFLKKKLIQLPRHHKDKVIIFSKNNLTVYRPTCSKNDNSRYNDWKKLDIKVNIEGFSCSHKQIYFKKFDSFLIILKSGGPISADPIFLETNDNSFFLVINKIQ